MNKSFFKHLIRFSVFFMFFGFFWKLRVRQVLPGNELIVNMGYPPSTFHPHKVNNCHEKILSRHLYEGLVRSGENGRLLPGLAKKIDVSEDGLNYRIELRESFWSDGRPLTADDFVRSWKNVIASERLSADSLHFDLIRGVKEFRNNMNDWDKVSLKADSKNIFSFSLEHRAPYFIEVLTLPIFYPVSSFDSDKCLVSNGPFRFKEFKWSQLIVLEKNPFFWDESSVSFSSIRFLLVEEAQTQTSLFESGDIHFMGGGFLAISKEAIDSLKRRGLLSGQYAVACEHYAILNTRRTIFQSKKVRQAFSMSLDRDRMQKGFFKRCIAAYSYLPPALRQEKNIPILIEENRDKAKLLFEEGMHELNFGESEEVEFLCTSLCLKLAQALQAQWFQNLGILVKVQCVSVPTMISRLSDGDFDFACYSQIASYRDPYSFFEEFSDSDSAFNATGWSPESFRDLLAKSFDFEDESRTVFFEKLEKIILEEVPVVPIAFGREVFSWHPSLEGFVVDELMMIDFSRARWRKESSSC
ncbi:peptide ABC transporter substrate-binding protein [Candidatus Similichlamydia epinepheli]|uniref:peptide ABC transporter substrate-binding protein n=1 Tax=Candidatus Similichlamydia epinepheli TaxID=1903953 RepID=UPI000D343637|nr:peptide ABC transporter substrate-binding protein [Candidatus Similichlamydia epinepheli]